MNYLWNVPTFYSNPSIKECYLQITITQPFYTICTLNRTRTYIKTLEVSYSIPWTMKAVTYYNGHPILDIGLLPSNLITGFWASRRNRTDIIWLEARDNNRYTILAISCVGPETSRLRLAYETSEIPYLPLAMLLTNKDLNLTPVSTLGHTGPTTFYRAPYTIIIPMVSNPSVIG